MISSIFCVHFESDQEPTAIACATYFSQLSLLAVPCKPGVLALLLCYLVLRPSAYAFPLPNFITVPWTHE